MEALKIAKEYMRINKQLKLKITGSLKRGEEPRDLDFISYARNLPNNKKYFVSEYKGYKVDIWKGNKVVQFRHDYPKHILIAIYKGLRENGYKLMDNHIINLETNEKIPFSIKKIFRLSGVRHRKVAGSSGKIQAILFDKNYYTINEAIKEFKKLGFKLLEGKEIHITNRFIRFRVLQPNYKKYKYRRLILSREKHIMAIYQI